MGERIKELSVALIGRNSACKTRFLNSSTSSDKPVSDNALDAETWWTTTATPTEAGLDHNPEHGFSPCGERLLPARLLHTSAADISEARGKGSGGCFRDPILMVVPAEMAFHQGKPRPGRAGVNPIRAAVVRTWERLGGQMPLTVALSVDFEAEGSSGSIATAATAVKAFIELVRDDMAGDGVRVVAVTPRTELWLREQESEGGRVSYRRGDSSFRIHPAFEQLMDKDDIERARAAFDICGGTGVMAAISAAVTLNPPTLVFPVGDFITMQSSGWNGDGAPVAKLRTCRLMQPSSSARDVFAVESEQGVQGGNLVSAEIAALPTSSAEIAIPSPLELDVPIGKGVWLLRLVGSRKAAQMWKSSAVASTGSKGGKPLASAQFGDLRSKDRRRGRS